MSRNSDIEKARQRAPSVADQVQLRIIEEKMKRGGRLFPDEEELFLRLGVAQKGASAKVLLIRNHDFGEFDHRKKDRLIVKLARILSLSERIKKHFSERNITSCFEQVGELELIATWEGAEDEGVRLFAYHLATDIRTTPEAVALTLIERAKLDEESQT